MNNGDPLTLESVTTAKFHKANPKWFDGSFAKTLKGVKIVKTIRKGEVWVVITTEDWGKGPVTAVYTVVTAGAEGRVDERSGAV